MLQKMVWKPRIYVDGVWCWLPERDGRVPGTPLQAHWEREESDGWSLARLHLSNTGTAPIRLGSCHLLEQAGEPGGGPDDCLLLDSGGGWFAGTVQVTAGMPNCAEYWSEIFVAAEDMAWARQCQDGDLSRGAHYSFGGMCACYRGAGQPVRILGFLVPLEKSNAFPVVLCDPHDGSERGWALVSNFAGFLLEPGATAASETALTALFSDPHVAIEAWSSFCAHRRGVVLPTTVPPSGWLSWYGYRLTIDEAEIGRVAALLEREFAGLGLRYMQVDLGYNTDNTPGLWFGCNSHFQGGMEHFVATVERHGLVPGVWIGACIVAADTPFAREHPEALNRLAGDPSRWPWEPHPETFYLDPTHPAAEAFLRRTIRHFKRFGIRYFKLDFLNRLACTSSEWRVHDPRCRRGVEPYRRALQIMREEMDPDDYLYSCSNLPFHGIGLQSTSMSACDIDNTGFKAALAAGDEGPLAFFRMQVTTFMSRYHAHGKLLLVNPDAINLAPPADLEEIRCRALAVALSGGQVFLGDRFDLAAPEMLALVRQLLPVWGRAARPVDLFRQPWPLGRPEIFHLRVPGRDLVGLLNFDREKEIVVALPELGLADGDYLVWEFYEQRFLGVVGSASVLRLTLPCPAARLLALTPVATHPQVISSSFHFTQGAMELRECRWDALTGRLSGKLCRPAGERGRLFMHVPAGWKADSGDCCEPGILAVAAQGNGIEQEWAVTFTRE